MKTDDTEANDSQLNAFSIYKLILYLHQHLVFYLSAFFDIISFSTYKYVNVTIHISSFDSNFIRLIYF